MDYVLLGMQSVFSGAAMFTVFGIGIPACLVMLFLGLLTGIAVGATPGLAGPTAMAVSLPILISIFGVRPDALLPVFGFLIGIMKGATVGGAVPAILFNVPGTPDAIMTTLDGHPMAKRGMPRRALRIAHISSVTGDTASDIVLFVCAPFLAIMVERFLDLPEKTAIIILSLTFISSVMGSSVGKGLIAVALGIVVATVATGQDFHPRLTLGIDGLQNGFPMVSAVLGILILGEIFITLNDMWRGRRRSSDAQSTSDGVTDGLRKGDLRRIMPHIARSSAIGTVIGALPGVGSTLAATLGYTVGRGIHNRRKAPEDLEFGKGAPEGIAATEAANSAVSGANLIPVLSLGIPGNAAAVFLILAADSIGGFNPGPAVFNFTHPQINPELVIAFGIFTLMAVGNLLNWTIGGLFMRSMAIMSRIPIRLLLPVVLLVTLTAIYIQDTRMAGLWIAFGFGLLGFFFRRLDIPALPFVIAFILAGTLENTARQAFSASGGDPFFLFKSVTSVIFLAMAVAIAVFLGRREGHGARAVSRNGQDLSCRTP